METIRLSTCDENVSFIQLTILSYFRPKTVKKIPSFWLLLSFFSSNVFTTQKNNRCTGDSMNLRCQTTQTLTTEVKFYIDLGS